jgi:hypothetical protein
MKARLFAGLSSLNYREITFEPDRAVWLNRQRGVQQIAETPKGQPIVTPTS